MSVDLKSVLVGARQVCTYLRPEFLSKLSGSVETIVEVGARDLLDSCCLANHFQAATVLAYECNPKSVGICQSIHNLLPKGLKDRIMFVGSALGSKEENKTFYPYVANNPGASSFFYRVDGKQTQKPIGVLPVRRLDNELARNKRQSIDLLCMDVQGFELNVLQGIDCSKIRYVIMEEPNGTFPNGPSHYIGAPSRQEIAAFMQAQGFKEIARSRENDYEDNVMYAQASILPTIPNSIKIQPSIPTTIPNTSKIQSSILPTIPKNIKSS
jgi:FkbM family methyltransferase